MKTSTPVEWYRKMRVGGKEFTTQGRPGDISQTITVNQSESDGLRFTADIWNLSRERWRHIKKDDPIEITLGYKDGISETVLLGKVKSRNSPTTTGADTKYTIEGIDKSEGRIRATRFHHVFSEPTVGRIVRRIAVESKVGVGRCAAPNDVFNRAFQIHERKPANRWLDQMAKRAETRDPQGREYDWGARKGALFFGPKEIAHTQSAVIMKQADRHNSGNILAGGLEEADHTDKSDGPPDLDFEIALDPRIERKALVSVQNAGGRNGIYQVLSYKHESSVRDGVHKTSGTMADKTAKFRLAQ